VADIQGEEFTSEVSAVNNRAFKDYLTNGKDNVNYIDVNRSFMPLSSRNDFNENHKRIEKFDRNKDPRWPTCAHVDSFSSHIFVLLKRKLNAVS
jgi:hypothetical protein